MAGSVRKVAHVFQTERLLWDKCQKAVSWHRGGRGPYLVFLDLARGRTLVSFLRWHGFSGEIWRVGLRELGRPTDDVVSSEMEAKKSQKILSKIQAEQGTFSYMQMVVVVEGDAVVGGSVVM